MTRRKNEADIIWNDRSSCAVYGGLWKSDKPAAKSRRTGSEAGTEEAGIPTARSAGDA